MRRRRLVLLSFAVLVPLAGCAFLQSLFSGAFQKPKLTFRSAELADASLGGITVDLNYTLNNPNPIGLSLAEVDYAFFVEGKQVVAGRPRNGLNIPANKAANLSFPANVRFADLGQVVQTFLTKDQASYRAEGSLGIKTPIGILKFPLSKQGTFEVPKLPQVQFATPRIANLSLTSATVEFPLTVVNRNSFPLPINNIGGTVQVAGANVGTLSTGQLGALAGKGRKELTLPLTIQFAQAAAAAVALRQGQASVGFSGQLQSGAVSLPISFRQNLSFRR